MKPFTDESHIVREGEAGRVRLTAFGWCAVAVLGTAVGSVAAALAIWISR